MQHTDNPHGVLLINLGTPDDTTTSAIRRYLRQFLNDPRVIDINPFWRKILVDGIITPFRPYQTRQAYQKIWYDSGPPLLVHSYRLQKRLQKRLGNGYQVEVAMRYGNPSIKQALTKLDQLHCSSLQVIPLFPQYSSAANGSALAATFEQLTKRHNIPHVRCYQAFYNDEGYIQALKRVIQENCARNTHCYLFSYHGLPERQVKYSENPNTPCDRISPCPSPAGGHQFCYRAQCYETSRLLARQLGLSDEQYEVSFQSRLGRTPWIKPYTEEVLPQLIDQGITNLTVVCPSFTADCLETLEEIGIRAREQWYKLGGQHLNLIPCLNEHPAWVEYLANKITH